MDNIIEILKNKKILIFIIVIFLIGLIIIIYCKKTLKNTTSFENNLINNIEENYSQKSVIEEENIEELQDIYIHIIGEVNNSGIVILKEGDRIIDAIDKAGGATEKADLSKVNLAYKLLDGQKVYIPNVNEEVNSINEKENIIIDGFSEIENEKININTATQSQLESLTGIGPSIAAQIIEYREKIGKFKNIEELKNVSGIGENKFEQIKKEVIVKWIELLNIIAFHNIIVYN